MSAFAIREADPSCLDILVNMEKECFSLPWSRDTLTEMLDSRFDTVWIAFLEEEAAGFLDFREIAGEGELMRVAVRPRFRNRGLGRMLLDKMLEKAENGGTETIVLEVRRSNAPAIALYTGAGFKQEAVRKNYYDEPQEDALILRRNR